MQHREKNKQLIVRVSEKEKQKIKKQMEVCGYSNFSAYARRMMLYGYHINVDLSLYHELATEVNRIGVNINQIAKAVNGQGFVHESEIK